jgi:DHA3 family macrolide efflux protein-like MFS transporter
MSGAGLLARERDFRQLFLASLISTGGTSLSMIALVLDVYDRTGSPTWVAALLVTAYAPAVFVGLFLGFLVDRVPRRRLLIATDLFRALIFASLLLAGSALQIVLLAVAAGTVSAFFGPASYAAVPNLVSDEDLPRANGLIQLAQSLASTLGLFAGGAIVAATGPRPAYLLDALSFLVSAALIVRIGRTLERERAPSKGRWRDVLSGLGVIRSFATLRIVLIVWSIALAGMALINVSEVVLVKRVFGAGDLGFGLAMAASALGILLGSLAVGGLIGRYSAARVYALAIGLIGIGAASVGIAPSLWVALPLLVGTGVGNAAALVAQRTLIQRGCPDELLGRAVAVIMALGNAVLASMMAAAGPITALLGARGAWEIAAGLLALACVCALVYRRKLTESIEGAGGEPVAAEALGTAYGPTLRSFPA